MPSAGQPQFTGGGGADWTLYQQEYLDALFWRIVTFILNLFAGSNPTWKQAQWFIDPQNVSGTANDSNDGATATTAVRTYNGGVVAKWGTVSPTLNQDTTLKFLSAQTDGSDPVIFRPVMNGVVATILGVLGPAQLAGTGILAGVVAKNRATGQLLEADMGAAYPVGVFIHNTTIGKDSYAWTFRNNGVAPFHVMTLTQPLAPCPAPFDATSFPNFAAAEVDTWANGDTFNAYNPLNVFLVEAKPTVAKYVLPNYPAQIQVRNITAWAPDGLVNENCFIGSDVTLLEMAFTSVLADQSAADDQTTFWANIFAGASVISGSSNPTFIAVYGGALLADAISLFVSANFEFDAIISAGGTGFSQATLGGVGPFFRPWTFPYLGTVYIDGTVSLSGVWNCTSGNSLSLASRVWGPGTLNLIGMSRCYYDAGVGAAAATFLCAALTINDQANVNAFAPSTGLFSASRALTAANLDTTIAGGGFAGLAVNVGGGAFTNQATP